MHDRTTSDVTDAINTLQCRSALRSYGIEAFDANSLSPWLPKPGRRGIRTLHPRVLVCGSMGTGKSTLINGYLGKKLVRLSYLPTYAGVEMLKLHDFSGYRRPRLAFSRT